ncbi:MAG: 4Fe-4S binding protein [Candidatus Helarchaeales archaeon]
MIPSFKHEIDENTQELSMRLLTLKTELIHHQDKCVGCNTCRIVCPKNAISRGPVGAVMKKLTDKVPSVVFDINKCSFCGTCVYLCPFDAIELKIDGEQKLSLKEERALPDLVIEMKKTKDDQPVKCYFEGKITIDATKCIPECQSCAYGCPVEAIEYPKREKPWDKVTAVKVDEEKCIKCGTCVHICPSDAITLERTEVKFKGEAGKDYTVPFWPNIVEKLTTKLQSPIK